jgi:diguanylate cyclase (GGDEF)-like protein
LRGLRVELARSLRYELPLSILMVDIDRFKSINDTHGHAAGDRALVAVARVARDAMREPDVLCRWGGEEIVVLLPNTGIDGAAIAAERLRERIERLEIELPTNTVLRVTASIGVTNLRSQDTSDTLFDRADRAMYEAKSDGRNRVVVERHAADSAGSESALVSEPATSNHPRASVHVLGNAKEEGRHA